jgi:hypothetical protein
MKGLQCGRLLGHHEGLVVGEHDAARPDANGVGPCGNGGHQHGRNRSSNAWHRVVFGHPKAVVTPFLGPLGALQYPVQGFRSRKPVPGVGAVEDGNSGKGKGHTAGTTPAEEEFRLTAGRRPKCRYSFRCCSSIRRTIIVMKHHQTAYYAAAAALTLVVAPLALALPAVSLAVPCASPLLATAAVNVCAPTATASAPASAPVQPVPSEPSPSPTLSAARQVRPAAPGNVVAPPAPSARVRVPSTTAAITQVAEASGPAPAASPASAATPPVPTAPALTAADDTSPASTDGAPRVLVGACLLVLGGLLVAVSAAIGLKRPDRAFPWP